MANIQLIAKAYNRHKFMTMIMMIAIVNTTKFQVNEEYHLQSFILNLDLTLKLNFFLFLSGINKNKIKH